MTKILVLGHARHGKDTVAERLAERLNISYTPASLIAAELIYDKFPVTFNSPEDAYNKRAQYRTVWFDTIAERCERNKTFLADLVFETNLIYAGTRAKDELDAIITKYKPIIIWVDASERCSPEHPDSMQIEYRRGWLRLTNNSTEEDLLKKVDLLVDQLLAYPARTKWDKRFMQLATSVATWSKDPECQVGAVLVSPGKREFAFGYNGLAAGLEDTKAILEDKDVKNSLIVHAEVNAILNARRDVGGWTLYCTKAPCLACANAMIQAGIAKLYCPAPLGTWADENKAALALLNQVGIYHD